MTIREAHPDDAPAVAEVHARSWQEAYRGVIPEEYLGRLDPGRLTGTWQNRLRGYPAEPGAGVLVAENDQGLVAFAGFAPVDDPDGDGLRAVELGAFYSLSEAWGTGINGELADAVHAAMAAGPLDRAFLWVLEANLRARRFYTAQGWEDTGTVVDRGLFRGAVVRPVVLYRRSL